MNYKPETKVEGKHRGGQLAWWSPGLYQVAKDYSAFLSQPTIVLITVSGCALKRQTRRGKFVLRGDRIEPFLFFLFDCFCPYHR